LYSSISGKRISRTGAIQVMPRDRRPKSADLIAKNPISATNARSI
jgi:hypothetical protein